MKHLTLVRGLPGSGKTSFMWRCVGDMLGVVYQIATDDFFMVDGKYQFDPKLLTENHEKCRLQVQEWLEGQKGDVWVHNTFSCRWEMEPYLTLAASNNYFVTVIDIFDGGCTDEELAKRNSHGVPIEGITAMRNRWEHDWKNGDPEPPWNRTTLIQDMGIASMAKTIVSGTDPIHEAEEAEKQMPDIDLEVSAEHQMNKNRRARS